MTSALRIGSNLLSVVLLVAVNLVPLIGVALWGWSLMLILVLYWVESGIVGIVNIFKIARAEGSLLPGLSDGGSTVRISGLGEMVGKGALIAFFIVHYGAFWAIHGTFVFLLPIFAGTSSGATDSVGPGFGSGPMDFGPLPLDALALSATLLAASHAVSFFTNYLGRGEYRRATPAGQMVSVYGRVVVLHITIIGGAFVIALFGTPIAALVLLVGLKTLLDLGLHLWSHRVTAAA